MANAIARRSTAKVTPGWWQPLSLWRGLATANYSRFFSNGLTVKGSCD